MAKSQATIKTAKLPPTMAERQTQGKSIRAKVSRKSHAVWEPPARRADPIEVLEKSNLGRIAELIPIRYGRMMKSPFTFFRGSSALMASDLAKTPSTGIKVQACGDCHLLNFGGFATPERNIILDINDFDETLPAPWEWDLKRLGTSFVLACRANTFKAEVCRSAAVAVARSYRESMHEFAQMRVLDVWYSKMDIDAYVAAVKDKEYNRDVRATIERQKQKSLIENILPKLTLEKNGRRIFKESPPLVYHSDEQHEKEFMEVAKQTIELYKQSLSEDRQVLFNRYELQDVAMKIVGIGSVGTYCAVLLLLAGQDDPLILQVKEAQASVLEPYAGKSVHKNHGQRVVAGQRLMQAQSDIFLGWAKGTGRYRRHFYLRQLKDMKMSPMPELWTAERAIEVAQSMGWILARAHARSGDAALISGYLGAKDVFDQAIADFSTSYADQTERDHDTLRKAIKSGRLEAYIER